MKGLLITELSFEDKLAYDEIFVEYFNVFLALPAFPKVVQYDPMSGTFQDANKEHNTITLQPSSDAEYESKRREKLMKWVKRERLPLFLRTRLYLEFKLCRLLIRKLRDARSTARDSSRGLRGHSRATSSTVFTPHGSRPDSNVSNQSWPGLPVKHFGRRPLGSATSLPGMLHLAGDDEAKHGDAKHGYLQRMNADAVLNQEEEKVEQAKQLLTDAKTDDETSKEDQQTTKQNREAEMTVDTLVENQGEDIAELDVDSEAAAADNELRAVMEFDEPDAVQAEADVKSIASKHHTTLQELKEQILGSSQGMTLFRAFLEDTVGIHLYNFWLDVERYKDSLQSEPEDSIRELRTKLFREILDKYKNRLTADAKEQIDQALFHGGVTQDLFTRTQYDMLRRLRSYWVPRFLVHLERHEEYRDEYFSRVNPRDQYRPHSSISFFPSLSLVHSIPPLGDWCREMVRCRKWNRDILIKDKRRRSGIQRLNTIPEGSLVDPFMSAFKAEKDAGYPFKCYLQGRKDKSLLANLCFWLDVKEFYAAEKRSGDRYLSRCNVWNIFNNYLALGADMNIGIHTAERKSIEKILHSSEELPLNLFAKTEEYSIKKLRIPWEDFKDFDRQRYRKPPKDRHDRTDSPSISGTRDIYDTDVQHYYSPTTGRWVRRHPGSSPSERGRRLFTSLAMAEEIDAARSISSSPDKRPQLPLQPSPGKKNKTKKKKKKAVAKNNAKNIAFRRKKQTHAPVSNSEGEESDSTDDKQEKAAAQVVPAFLDVVENKGTMAAFKQYVQNMEGRQAFNQLVMYLEIEQYFGMPPAKKTQKSQQATTIFKTFFDPTSRRSVSLPSLLLDKIDADRPSSPVLAEAQQAVKLDVETNFKTFFKHAQEASPKQGDAGSFTPNTPGRGSKVDALESSQSFMQFYKRKAQKKAKNTGRSQPSKDDRDEFKRILQSTHGRMPVKLEMFRRYLQNHSDPDIFPRHENDLFFYLEVQKLKDLFNYMDDTSLNRKVEAIIECFLDSASPPWLQIDISPELASRIIHKAQMFSSAKKASREQKDPGLFDEAQSILFKELLPYWAGFRKQYKQPDDESNLKLPPTKHEKILQRRYNEFIKYQAVTGTLVLPPVNPTAGQSRSEATFSVSDGMRWKDRKEVDTVSIISSVQGSVSGTAARKASTMATSSIQPIDVSS